MAEQPEVIRKQMEETRASLTEKLEALENQVTEKVEATTEAVSGTVEAVKETVENVTETVQETVENVTDKVQATVHTVAETFNLKRQFDRHPWLMFGGAVTLGCMAAYLLGGKKSHHGDGEESWEGEEGPQTTSRRASAFAESASWHEPERSSAPSWQQRSEEPSQPQEEGKKSWFWEEVDHLKNMAVGTLMGAIGDMAARSLPEGLGKKVAEEADHLASRLGAEPIHGTLVSDQK